MKKSIQFALVTAGIVMTSLMSGCASTPITPEQIAQGDYGPAPSNYEQAIKSIFSSSLKDPYSAVYRFGSPYKGYLTKAPVAGGGIDQFGWMLEVAVNAKNSFGGYTGEKSYRFFYKNGQWRDVSHLTRR